LLVTVLCLILGSGFVVGLRYTQSRANKRTTGTAGQYLDDSWQKTTGRHEKALSPKKRRKPETQEGRVAIVIDDLGPNLKHAERLLDLDRHLTLAVIPWQIHSEEILQRASETGAEAILHQPMEAHHEEGSGMPGMLYLRMSDREIRETLAKNLDAYAVVAGMNNHMGSALTEDERALGVVFQVLRERGLYFLDSRTSAQTVGKKLARVEGLPFFERDVFLDNESDHDYMAGMWDRFIGEARTRGYAVLIAHGRTESIDFLAARLPELGRDGFRLVRLSELYSGDPDA